MEATPSHLIRFAQTHENFRLAELEALSALAHLPVNVVSYSDNSPFCVVKLPILCHPSREGGDSRSQAENGLVLRDAKVRAFGSRSMLAKSIYEICGQGRGYKELHEDVRRQNPELWEMFREKSFKFSIDCYGSTRDVVQQTEIINSFRYLDFRGKIRMKNPEVEFAVLEEWLHLGVEGETTFMTDQQVDLISGTTLRRVFFVRKIGDSCRWLKDKHDLKKRPYISTTSMDAELALLTANMALAASGKIFLDPFVGTGGFMVAAAEMGAMVLGSDIDGRSFRGKGLGLDKGVAANLRKYGLTHLFGDCFTSDLTNTPFRTSASSSGVLGGRWLDGIICDPPYGVREGLKVLGTKFRPNRLPAVEDEGDTPKAGKSNVTLSATLIDGIPAHTLPGYIAPKKPYSFTRMLDDILDFAARTLVDGGRLAFWMPSANENDFGEEEATAIPSHRHLELKHECVQRFNKWSRRLLVYERRPGKSDSKIDLRPSDAQGTVEAHVDARTADELNPFRRRYFQSFVADRNGN